MFFFFISLLLQNALGVKRGTFQLKMFCSEIMSNYFAINTYLVWKKCKVRCSVFQLGFMTDLFLIVDSLFFGSTSSYRTDHMLGVCPSFRMMGLKKARWKKKRKRQMMLKYVYYSQVNNVIVSK